MRKIQDDYRLAVLADPVAHSAVKSAPGGMLPGVFVTQPMADTVWVAQQRAGVELRRSRGDLLRQPAAQALGPGTHIELPPSRPGRSRSAGAREQVSGATAESRFIQAGAILPRTRLLSRGSALARIPAPPRR